MKYCFDGGRYRAFCELWIFTLTVWNRYINWDFFKWWVNWMLLIACLKLWFWILCPLLFVPWSRAKLYMNWLICSGPSISPCQPHPFDESLYSYSYALSLAVLIKMEEVSWMDDFKISGNLSIHNFVALKEKWLLICMLWGVKANTIE